MAGRGDIQAGKAYVTTYIKNDPLIKGITALKSHLQGLGTGVMKIGGLLTGIGAAVGAPIMAAVQKFVTMGTELDTLSKRTGIGVQALAEFRHAAEQTGAALGDVEGASKSITKNIADAAMGGQGAAITLSRLGLTAEGLKTQLPEDQLQTIADRLKGIKDPAQQAALATQLLGGTNLLPMVRQLGDLRKEARALGVIPTDKAIADAKNLGSMIKKAMSVVTSSIFEVGAAVAPLLTPIIDAFINVAAGVNRWIRENGALIRTFAMVAAGVFAIGAIVTAVGAAIFGVGTALGFIVSSIMAVGSAIAFITSPLGLMTALLAGGIFLWAKFTDNGKQAVTTLGTLFTDLKNTLFDSFAGIGDALKAGDLQLAAKIAITGIQLAFMQGIKAITDLIQGQFGDTLGTVATQLIKGDFMGAWQTSLKQLSSWHATVVEAITEAWTGAARIAVEAWRDTLTSISDWLLDAAAKGNPVATAIVGNVKGSIAQNAAMEAGNKDVKIRNEERAISLHRQSLAGARASGNQADIAKFTKAIAEAEKQIAAVRGGAKGPDLLQIAKADARQQTGAMVDAVLAGIRDYELTVQDNAVKARADIASNTAGGMSGLPAELAALQAQLLALRTQAADAAAKAPRWKDDRNPAAPRGGDIAAGAALRQNIGTFSGAALVMAGGGDGGIARKQLRVQEEQRELQRKNLEVADKNLAAVEKWKLVMGGGA